MFGPKKINVYSQNTHTSCVYFDIKFQLQLSIKRYQTNLIPLYRKQKHEIRAIHSEDKRFDETTLLTCINALNVYQLNKSRIFQTLIFMFKTKLKLVPNIFQNFFNETRN